MENKRSNSEIVSPRLIRFAVYLLFAFPLVYPMFLSVLYNLPIPKILKISFSWTHAVLALLAYLCAWSLRRMRPYAWHVSFFLGALLIVHQVYVALALAENYYVHFPLIIAILVIWLFLYLIKSELRVPYFSPRIAWWESDPRYKISVPTKITTPDHLYEGEIMDVSTGGCFVKTKAALKANQILHIRFSLFDQEFSLSGKIVWRTEATVTLPKGVGIKFLGMTRKEQIDLKSTVKKLEEMSERFQHKRREERAAIIQKKIENLLGPK